VDASSEELRMSDYEYLLVARHGRVDELASVRKVARRLVETLDELEGSPTPATVNAVEHADTEASRRTAEVFAEELGVRAQMGEVALGPDRFPAFSPRQGRSRARPGTLTGRSRR
jgi:hypothetical protein